MLDMETTLADLWPVYENSDRVPYFGDVVAGIAREWGEGQRDVQGEFFSLEIEVTENGVYRVNPEIEDDDGNDFYLVSDYLVLIEAGDAV